MHTALRSENGSTLNIAVQEAVDSENWVSATLSLEAPGFQGNTECMLHASDLIGLQEMLASILQSRHVIRSFEAMERGLSLKVRDSGHSSIVVIEAEIFSELSQARLRATIEADRLFLSEFHGGLELANLKLGLTL
jgi:hypothetical protein